MLFRSAAGGVLRDWVGHMAAAGALGPGLTGPAAGYTVVYHTEIGLLFATLIAIGPLVRFAPSNTVAAPGGFGLARLPG